jgi:hypothetical protein
MPMLSTLRPLPPFACASSFVSIVLGVLVGIDFTLIWILPRAPSPDIYPPESNGMSSPRTFLGDSKGRRRGTLRPMHQEHTITNAQSWDTSIHSRFALESLRILTPDSMDSIDSIARSWKQGAVGASDFRLASAICVRRRGMEYVMAGARGLCHASASPFAPSQPPCAHLPILGSPCSSDTRHSS